MSGIVQDAGNWLFASWDLGILIFLIFFSVAFISIDSKITLLLTTNQILFFGERNLPKQNIIEIYPLYKI